MKKKEKQKELQPEKLPYTKRLKLEKQERQFWKRFNIDNYEDIQSHYQRVDFRCTAIRDEELALLAGRVQSIEMLDMNDTQITKEGIRHLSKLKSLQELRVKDCADLDDECAVYLNQIQGLKLLNIKGTRITINGLLQLENLQDLKILIFSSDISDDFQQKLHRLAELLPDCELIVDGKTYGMKR